MSREEKQNLSLLDELYGVLEKQKNLACQGSFAAVEALGERASVLVGKIGEAGGFESEEFRNRRSDFTKMYQELHLTVSSRKSVISDELGKVRKGKKVLNTYRKNV